MKILFLVFNLDAGGGIARYNNNFINSLKELGEQAIIVELRGTTLFSKVRFALNFFYKTAVCKPDITVCTNINFSPLCYLAKLLFKRQYSVTVYGVEVESISPFYLRTLKSARFIVKLFDEAARNVVRQLPKARDKILSLPNSVDGKRFFIKGKSPELIHRHGLTDSKIILTICRLSSSERDNKGYEKVIRAMPHVLQSVPNAKYILAGEGDDRSYLEKIIKELKLEENVMLVGYVKDEEMIDYYNLADIFVYPSKKEGFPAIILLEALACGRPIIGGNQPDAKNKLWENELGIIVDADNVEAIAESIIKVLTDNIPRHLLNPQFLRKRVLDEYGPERYKKHVQNILTRFKSLR